MTNNSIQIKAHTIALCLVLLLLLFLYLLTGLSITSSKTKVKETVLQFTFSSGYAENREAQSNTGKGITQRVKKINEQVFTQKSEKTISIDTLAEKLPIEENFPELNAKNTEKASNKQERISKNKKNQTIETETEDILNNIFNAPNSTRETQNTKNSIEKKLDKILAHQRKEGYVLGLRKVLKKIKPKYNCKEEGIVVVSILVSSEGKVIEAEPGYKGTTTTSTCLIEEAYKSALKTIWEEDSNTVLQRGKIIYKFSISQ